MKFHKLEETTSICEFFVPYKLDDEIVTYITPNSLIEVKTDENFKQNLSSIRKWDGITKIIES